MVMWHVWKSRCARLYDGQHSNSFSYLQDMQVELSTISREEGRSVSPDQILGVTASDFDLATQVPPSTALCWVDGSYAEDVSGYTGVLRKYSKRMRS